MPTGFEVGKKYRHHYEKGIVRECLYVCKVAGGIWAMLSGTKDNSCPVCRQWGTEWFEYIEPLKKIEYVYEIEGKLHILATPHNDNTGRLKYISTIELTFDIHNGLKVEVLKGIG